jgi:coproporphyrinogen III oxidase-like Fe-S oxidoreductase
LRLTGGVNEKYFHNHTETVQRFINGGLLERSDTHLRLTSKGMDIANRVFMEFM